METHIIHEYDKDFYDSVLKVRAVQLQIVPSRITGIHGKVSVCFDIISHVVYRSSCISGFERIHVKPFGNRCC